MTSSSKPSGVATTTQNRDPWAGQQPYLSTGFEKAKSYLDQPLQYYPQSTVVPFAPQTEQALGRAETRATQGSPLMQDASGTLKNMVRGDYLSAGNPYLQNAFNAAAQPITSAYQQTVLPGINSTFSAGGRYGSGAHQNAIGQANEKLARSLSDVGGSMSYQNYSQGLGNMLQASQMAPTFAQQDYTDIAQLADVGKTREAQAGSQLKEAIDRYMFGQQAPRDALKEYMASVAGGQYGDITTQQPIYSNPFGQAIGGLATGAGIAGTLFGGSGVWPGALKF